MNNDLMTINAILERRKQDIDCTEQESAELKGWLRDNPLPSDMRNDIADLFPLEYMEHLDETE
jgi:hypothetical protein